MITRKQAIQKAIEVMSKSPEYAEEVRKLKELCEEMPLVHWSQESIHDTVQQFVLENGRMPTVTDFKRKNMPAHTVVTQKFGMILSEWLAVYYPTPKPDPEVVKAECTELFMRDYYRIKPKSQEEFNAQKGEATKGWQTIAHYHGVKSWRKLIKKLDLPLYFQMHRDHVPVAFQVDVINDYDFVN